MAAAEPPLAQGQVMTVFRSRRRDSAEAAYLQVAEEMESAARASAGFVDFKSFEAEDGERVSVVTFASMETHRAWRDHPEHRAAQQRGRDSFYASYDISVGEIIGESHFPGP